jgi:phosphoadenosine phosphosulfate reductase
MRGVNDVILNPETASNDLRQASPQRIVDWALDSARRPIITTNFGPYSAVLLHMVTRACPQIPVIWADSGYNTRYTYLHAEQMIERLKLNIQVYNPLQSAARRNATMGLPEVDDPRHELFTEQVKLEPMRRAMAEAEPDVWLTGIRREQTEHRKSLDIVTQDKRGGLVKVAPVFHWSEAQMQAYLDEHDLPNETRYFDPTKVLDNRECGLHTRRIA